MNSVNKSAKTVLNILVSKLIENESLKIENSQGVFMPVHVEKYRSTYLGCIYSVAHYGILNSDLMSDPRMEFLKLKDGNFVPTLFENHYAGVYQESVIIEANTIKCNIRLQKDHTRFANMWMKNIKEQQGL